MSIKPLSTLPFSASSEEFAFFRRLWNEELHEDITYQTAEGYGIKILVLLALVVRARRLGL